MAVRFLSRLLCLASALFLVGAASAEQQKLLVYSSMTEPLLVQLKEAFTEHHPDIDLQYQEGGAARLVARISAEHETGKLLADVLWTGEVADFYQLKAQGALLPYVPADIKALVNPFPDYDGSFTAARLLTYGMAYNTRYVAEAPKGWQDAYKPVFKDAFGVPNPTLSGGAYLSVALLLRNFGWSYFEALHANGARLGKGSAQLGDDIAAGELLGGLVADHIAYERIQKGDPLVMVYPAEPIVVPGPIAILKGGPNNEAAKKYVDFVLSREGQEIIASGGMLPVRADVVVPERYNLPPLAEATKRARLDYPYLIGERENIIKRFTEIMKRDTEEKR